MLPSTHPAHPAADRLLITSAFSNLLIPGVIYVEAHKDTHVKAAVDGIQVPRVCVWVTMTVCEGEKIFHGVSLVD